MSVSGGSDGASAGFVERLGGGEQQRLDDAQMHRVDCGGLFLASEQARLEARSSSTATGSPTDVGKLGFDNLGHVGLVSADDAIHGTVSSAPCTRSFRKISPNGAI